MVFCFYTIIFIPLLSNFKLNTYSKEIGSICIKEKCDEDTIHYSILLSRNVTYSTIYGKNYEIKVMKSIDKLGYNDDNKLNQYIIDHIEINKNQSSARVDEDNVLVIVSFPYNGELIALAHIDYLYPYVDLFIIVEAKRTYSGLLKEQLYIDQNHQLFEGYLDKIKFIIIEDFPSTKPTYWRLSNVYYNNDNKELERNWFREEYQRNILSDYLINSYHDHKYVLIVCDADEIINIDLIEHMKERSTFQSLISPIRLNMSLFYYNYHWKAGDSWTHAFIINNEAIKIYSLSKVRTKFIINRIVEYAGWHCSYCLSIYEIKRKIKSFSHGEVNKEEYTNEEHIYFSILNGIDLFQRNLFTSNILGSSDSSSRTSQLERIEDLSMFLPNKLIEFNKKLLIEQQIDNRYNSNSE